MLKAMKKTEVIKKILGLVEAQGTDILNASNGVGWMGQSSGLQQQVVEAVRSWTEYDDPQPLLGIVEMLQTLSMVTSQEADELQQSIVDAQGRTKRV